MDLFDLIEQEEFKEDPDRCQHRHEEKTLTVWPGEDFERLTWTCTVCGHVRGRAQ